MVNDDSLENINVYKWPFKHACIKDFFKWDNYSSILKFLPHHSTYSRDQFNIKQNRYELWLDKKNINNLDLESSKFWSALRRNITDRGFDLLNLCACHIGVDQNSTYSPDQYRVHLRLVREHCPFTLTPHLDMQTKSFVIVVYLASDEQFKDYGTELYKKIGPYFLPIRRIPYVPNFALIIPRTTNAWHGGRWNKFFIRNTLHIYLTHYSEQN